MEKGNQPPPYTPYAPTAPPPGFVMPEQQCYPALPVTDPAPTVIHMQTQQAAPPVQVVVVGGCPSCRVGVVSTSHITFCGILWAILLFPFGLLCLLCCTKDRCNNCSYTK